MALRLWEELARDIGRDLGFRRTGLYWTSDNPQHLSDWEAWVKNVGLPFGVRTRMLTAAEASALVPAGGGTKLLGGIHSADDGTAEPSLAAPVIAEGARSLGATIHQECAARGLDITNGAVTGVVTERGMIRTKAVVCSGGAWASAFCRRHGVSFPQASVRSSILRTRPINGLPQALFTPECALTRRVDGSYTLAIGGRGKLEFTPQGLRYAHRFMPMFMKRIKAVDIGVGRSFFSGPEALGSWDFDEVTPFERTRVLDPAPEQRIIKELLQRFGRLYPALADIPVAEAWGAYIDNTPDAVPVISSVDQIKGFVLAAGFSAHGFGIGPAAGQLAASLVTNEAPPVDPKPFRLSRFFDGSGLAVGPI
ncbi:4-methylaminobutanoate oxidase (formaldehyde-forming) [compost metagenome]